MALSWVGMLKKNVQAVNKAGKNAARKAFVEALKKAQSKNIPKTKTGPLMEKVVKKKKKKKAKAARTDRTEAIRRGLKQAGVKFKTDRERRKGY